MKPDLETLHRQLKSEKNQKGEISRQFKNLEKNSLEYSDLLLAMQAISGRIKATEEQIKLQTQKDTTEKNHVEEINPEEPFAHIKNKLAFNKTFHCKIIQVAQLVRWDVFLNKQQASGYHRSNWLNLIQSTFGHETIVIIAEDEHGEIIGGLPLTFFSSKLFGAFAISIPYVNYGGVVSNFMNVAQALFNYARQLRADKQLSHIEIRTMQSGLAENSLDKKVSMVLALPHSDEELDRQLGAKVRAQYKKAEMYKPSVKFGKTDLLNDFYTVFSRNMRDLGTPVYSKTWFKNILNTTGIASTIVVIYMEGKPVSTGFLVGHEHMLEIPWASTIQSANAKNANMWMYRQILSYAISQKYKFFDFGRSTLGAGTYKFKKQWGALPHPHYWYYLLADDEQKPELNPDNPKYKLIIFLWKLMPVWLTKIIGPHIIKHIP